MIRRFGEFMGNVPIADGDTGPNLRKNMGPNPPGTRALRSGEYPVSDAYNRPHAGHVENTDYLDWLLTQEIAIPTTIEIDLGAALTAGAVNLVTGAHEIDLGHSFFDSLFPAWANGRVFHGDVDTADAISHHFSIYDDEGAELCDFSSGNIRIYGVAVSAVYGNPVGGQIAIAGPSLIAETRRQGVVVPPAIYDLAQPGDVLELTNAGLENTGQYMIRRVDTLNGFIELMGFSTTPTTDDVKAQPVHLDINELGEATLRSNGKSSYRPTVRLSGAVPSAYLTRTVQLVLGLGMRFPVPGDSITTLGVRSAPPMVWAVLKRFMEVTWEDITAHTPYEDEATTLEKANTDLLASNLQTAYDQSLGKGNSNPPGTGRVVTVTDGPVQLNVEPSGDDGHHSGLSVREDSNTSLYKGLAIDAVTRTAETLPFVWRERVARFTVVGYFMGDSNFVSADWTNTSPPVDETEVKEDRESPLGDGIQALVPYIIEIPKGSTNQGLYIVESTIPTGFYVKTLWGDAVSFDSGTSSDITVYAMSVVANWLEASLTAITEERHGREIAFRGVVDSPDHSGFVIDDIEAAGAGDPVRLMDGTGRGHLYAGKYEREDQSVIGAADGYADTDSSKKPATVIRASLPNCQYNSRRTAVTVELPAHTEGVGEGGSAPWSPLDGVQIRSHVKKFALEFSNGVNLLASGNIQAGGPINFNDIFASSSWVKPSDPLASTLGCDYYVELFGCEDERDCGIYRILEVVSATTLKLANPLTGTEAAFNAPYGGGQMRMFVRDMSFRATGDLIERAYIRLVLPSKSTTADERGIVINALDPTVDGSAILIRGRHYRVSPGLADGSIIHVETDQDGDGAGSCFAALALADSDIESLYSAIVSPSSSLSKGAYYTRIEEDGQVGLYADMVADETYGASIVSGGTPVFRVRHEASGYDWIEFNEAYAIDQIGTTNPTAFHKMDEENKLGYIDWVFSGLILTPVHRDIITIGRESAYVEDGTNVTIGHTDHRTVTTMAENPEGEGRRDSGTLNERPLDKQPVFPFWSGNRPYENRIVPVALSGFVGSHWSRPIYGEIVPPFLEIDSPVDTNKPIALPIKADPGSVIMGARTFLLASTTGTWPIEIEAQVGIYREGPILWTCEGSDTYARHRVDGRIGYIPRPEGLNQIFANSSLHANTAVLGPPAGPRTVNLSFPDPATIDNKSPFSPIEVDLLDSAGDPVWLSLTATTIQLHTIDGSDQVYRVKYGGFGSYYRYIRAHQSGGNVTNFHLREMSMPFIGDYLWVAEGSAAGLYPISETRDNGGELEIYFLSKELVPEVTNVKTKIPAIVNPGTSVYLYFHILDPGTATSLSIYPGVAYTKSYNDLSAAGFPFSPTDTTAPGGGRFPYSPT